MTFQRIQAPPGAEILREHSELTKVWRDGDTVFKQQPKYLSDNEYAFLFAMRDSGYVPGNLRSWDIETISMDYIEPQKVTDPESFLDHYSKVLMALSARGIRHGDLTTFAIIVNDNRPYLIDFAESRWYWDRAPAKRPVSDSKLLLESMYVLCGVFPTYE